MTGDRNEIIWSCNILFSILNTETLNKQNLLKHNILYISESNSQTL